MTTQQLFEHIIVWFGLPNQIRIYRKCKLSERDHVEDPRVFAHVLCRRTDTICLCQDFDLLPDGHKLGIILHEIGHLMSGGGEAEADLWVQDHLGIDIDFRDLVQWVDPKQVGL